MTSVATILAFSAGVLVLGVLLLFLIAYKLDMLETNLSDDLLTNHPLLKKEEKMNPVQPEVSTNVFAIYKKAVYAFVTTVISALLLVLPADGGFADLTLVQWLGVVLAVVAAPGAVAVATNAADGR